MYYAEVVAEATKVMEKIRECFNVKMLSFQYWNSLCKNKSVVGLYNFDNWNPLPKILPLLKYIFPPASDCRDMAMVDTKSNSSGFIMYTLIYMPCYWKVTLPTVWLYVETQVVNKNMILINIICYLKKFLWLTTMRSYKLLTTAHEVKPHDKWPSKWLLQLGLLVWLKNIIESMGSLWGYELFPDSRGIQIDLD